MANRLLKQGKSDRTCSTLTLISVCCADDISVWAVASYCLISRIPAKSYVVIVPDQDVEQFLALSPAEYSVLPESLFVGGVKARIEARLPEYNRHRAGWYLQQFIKLAAVKHFGEYGDVLIWDADTVPLKRIRFFEKSGRVRLYYCKEHHRPYFLTLQRLLNLDKIFRYSFIAQCFYVQHNWISQFFQAIEDQHQLPWMDAILQAINEREISSFSEYETLGTFVMSRFPDEIVMCKAIWSRRGNLLLGDVSKIDTVFAHLVLFPFSFVSFERWDRPMALKERILLRIGRALKW